MLKIPFNGDVRITNPFSKVHRGTDYALVNRTAIFSLTDGVIKKTESDISKKTKGGIRQWIANTQNDPFKKQLGGVLFIRPLRTEDYGNYVKIDHGSKVSTLYAHLDETVVTVGQEVKEGQLIGYSDSTGNSTGGHLHLEIRVNDVVIDPGKFDYSFKGKGGEEIKVYPLETIVEIVVSALYVRRGPSRKESLSGSKEIHKGDIINVIGYVEGEAVEGNKFWWKSTKGNYFWAGGTNKPHPELTLDGQKSIDMTSAERESKIHDFAVWKEGLDSRHAELVDAVAKNDAELADYEVKYAEFLAEPVVDEVPVVEEQPVVEAEPVAEEPQAEVVPESEEEVAQKAKLLEMYEWLKSTLGK